jgi:ubiquinone/menaquinone biosynthesis C-methylase UbiE
MQKSVFLDEEGDAWFKRNQGALSKRLSDGEDSIVSAIAKTLSIIPNESGRLLEVGCGGGERLSWLTENYRIECYGVDPSSEAVDTAQKAGLNVVKGTADTLPYESNDFDIVVFGFCLYLCDREDLFRIAQEANRVLNPTGWIIIQDFFTQTPISRDYCHKAGVKSYKMDYRTLFDWHPAYTCFAHEIKHHEKNGFTDDIDEWVGISVLRKNKVS